MTPRRQTITLLNSIIVPAATEAVGDGSRRMNTVDGRRQTVHAGSPPKRVREVTAALCVAVSGGSA